MRTTTKWILAGGISLVAASAGIGWQVWHPLAAAPKIWVHPPAVSVQVESTATPPSASTPASNTPSVAAQSTSSTHAAAVSATQSAQTSAPSTPARSTPVTTATPTKTVASPAPAPTSISTTPTPPPAQQNPSLAASATAQPVASTATMTQNLSNPSVLGMLNWSATDTQTVLQAMGSRSNPASVTANYALTFLYAGLANNMSVLNSTIVGGGWPWDADDAEFTHQRVARGSNCTETPGCPATCC